MIAPGKKRYEVSVAAVAAGSDLNTIIGVVREAGVITSVEFIPNAAITGANTDSRTPSVINKGPANAGTANAATLAMVSGVNSAAFTPKTIPVNGTLANVTVAVGDVLVWNSLHIGSTGLADPGGRVVVTVTRSVS